MKISKMMKKYEETKDFNECNINVKEYLPFQFKMEIFEQEGKTKDETILDNVIQVENGIAQIHWFNYELLSMQLLGVYYCRIDFEDLINSEKYDFLYQNRFKDWLHKQTNGDSGTFLYWYKTLVMQRVDVYNMKQSNMASQLDSVMKQFENINPENMDIIKKAMEEVQRKEIAKEAKDELAEKKAEKNA